ncbi:universal stress protein [Streptomyces sp. NBC_01102]|nr:universal stress protein [Streptomyces sp. NBC_01102]
MTGNVAVGVNGSPESVAAVRWAAREAALRAVALRIIHVREWRVPPERLEHVAAWGSTRDGPVPPERSREYEELLQQAARVAEQAEPGLAVVAEELAGEGLAHRALLAELETPGKDP